MPSALRTRPTLRESNYAVGVRDTEFTYGPASLEECLTIESSAGECIWRLRKDWSSVLVMVDDGNGGWAPAEAKKPVPENAQFEAVEEPTSRESANAAPAINTNEPTPSDDQKAAYAKITRWIARQDVRDHPEFVLRGSAGTGKTWLMRLVLDNHPKVNFVFTAPTNKAAHELAKALGVKVRTTFSAFGLRMEANEDTLVLTQSENAPVYSQYSVVVVDEAGTASKTLVNAVVNAAMEQRLLVLWIGDPAQWTPVGESMSQVWRRAQRFDDSCKARLNQIMRFDNQILNLSVKLRQCIRDKYYKSPIVSDHSADEGVWKWRTQSQWCRRFEDMIASVEDRRVIAWRNKTVEEYNTLVRSMRWPGKLGRFVVGDLVMMAEPMIVDGTIISFIDDEYIVTEVADVTRTIVGHEYECWSLRAVAKDRVQWLTVVKNDYAYNDNRSRLATLARSAKDRRSRSQLWRDFWELNNTVQKLRYGYALTSHRAQGSTYERVWVDQSDLLANHNSREAFRGLYVASTRPTTQLHTF